MRNSHKFRMLLAMLALLAMVATACASEDEGDGDVTDDPTEEEAMDEETDAEPTDEDTEAAASDAPTDDAGTEEETAGLTCPTGNEALVAEEGGGAAQEAQTVDKTENTGGEGVLDIGTILPETGDLAFLGPPEFAGVDLAIADINAAGGVLGSEVTISHGDSGDTSTDLASQEATRLLNAGVDVIIGAASSGVSLTFIDQVTGAGVVHFSPANTSPTFTDYDDNGLYFRTAPSDILQGRILSDLALGDGFTNVAVMARDDDYGVNLKDAFIQFFEESGGTITTELSYDPTAQNFEAEVDEIVGSSPEAILLIGFSESGQIINSLDERSFGPNDVQVYGTDGNMGNSLAEQVSDATLLACMKGTIPLTELGEEFQERLLEVNPDLVDFSYSAESYDAVVISALAAAVAGSDAGVDVGAAINDVTRGGEKCMSFEECIALIDGGTTDIDYDGVGGPYEFIDAGEPGAAVFAIPQFDATGALQIPEYQQAAL